jgi:hypothetical protein
VAAPTAGCATLAGYDSGFRKGDLVDCEILFYLNLEQDLYHASSIYTGLCQLSDRGLLRVEFVVRQRNPDSAMDSANTILMRVRFCKSGKAVLIAIDLSDHSSLVTPRALEACDVYLKRSFYKPDLDWLPDQLRVKILPFGFNYACKSSSSLLVILGKLLPTFLRRAWARQRPLQTFIPVLEQFLMTPNVRAFEYDPMQKVKLAITFQTRVWSPEEVTENVHELNEGRVTLIRALKKAFGSRFQGGLVPTSYARQHYPQDVSKRSPRRYVTWSKKNLIGINTRGLFHSVAFKLAEYYAASKCVVSCPIRNELPVPLVEGQHYLTFRTVEECVDHCDDLLCKRNLAMRLRQEAWEYYRNEIEPAAHLRISLRRIAKLLCI